MPSTDRTYHQALEAAGHKLRRDPDGSVDIFVLDTGHHNGPGCILCGERWCHHCEDEIAPCPGAGQDDTEPSDTDARQILGTLCLRIRTLAARGDINLSEIRNELDAAEAYVRREP